MQLMGSQSMERRNAQIEAFSNDPEVRVFLMSLKAGGVALNLTAASYCFLMVCAPLLLAGPGDGCFAWGARSEQRLLRACSCREALRPLPTPQIMAFTRTCRTLGGTLLGSGRRWTASTGLGAQGPCVR